MARWALWWYTMGSMAPEAEAMFFMSKKFTKNEPRTRFFKVTKPSYFVWTHIAVSPKTSGRLKRDRNHLGNQTVGVGKAGSNGQLIKFQCLDHHIPLGDNPP